MKIILFPKLYKKPRKTSDGRLSRIDIAKEEKGIGVKQSLCFLFLNNN